jgi:DNA-binding transcriptional LysR family regulator
MTLRRIDLNLLVIFEAIAVERSITRAAARVGLTQSAMSHALRRLRATFKDDLVSRSPEGLILTPRALQLAQALQRPLQEIEDVVDHQLNFDSNTSNRVFNLQISDYLVGLLLPGLYARLQSVAPQITLTVKHHSAANGFDPASDLHLIFCSDVVTKQDYRRERLFKDKYVVVFRHGHPAANQKMTLKLFLELSYVKVASAIIGSSGMDDALANRGLSRRTALTLPSSSGIIPIIKNTNLCAVLPVSWLRMHGALSEFSVSPVPISNFEFTVDQFYKASHAQDSGLRWLCNLIHAEFQVMRTQTGI